MKFTQQLRRTSALFWESPWLLVPVLAADTCKFAIAQAGILLRHAVIMALLPRSALGGYAGPEVGTPMKPALAAGLLQWIEYGISIALYLYALGVLARAVGAVQDGRPAREAISWRPSANLLPTLWRVIPWLFVVIVAMGFVVVLGFSRDSSLMTPDVLVALCVCAALTLMSPAIRRFIEANAPVGTSRISTRAQDAMWLTFGALVSGIVSFSAQYVLQRDADLAKLSWHPVWWKLLLLAVSLVSALPYAFAFLGLSLRAPKPGLFVYGTLHPDRAPAEVRSLTRRFVSLGTGTVTGRLLDLGDYPGLVLEGELEPIRGELFQVPEDAWPALDAYEGFDADRPQASLFVRQLCAVQTDTGATESHWVYVFRGGATP